MAGALAGEGKASNLEGSNGKDSKAESSKGSTKAESDPPVYVIGEEDEFRFKWDNGLYGETKDKAFRFHLGGRLHFDNAWYTEPESGGVYLTDPQDGSALRRLRLRAAGTYWEQFDFMIEFDVSGGSDFRSTRSEPLTTIFITDAWVTMREVPWVHNIRVGHQKEFLTFTNATSSRHILFIERPFIFDAFENDIQFDNGVTLFRNWWDESVFTWIGFFRTDTRTGGTGVGDGTYAVDGRWTYMPIYDEVEQRWLNLGVSGSLRALPADQEDRVRIRALVRGGTSFQVPTLADTGTFFGTDGLQVGTASIHGAWQRWTFGGEYMFQTTNDSFLGGLPKPDGSLPMGVTPAGDLFFQGWYVQLLYFLTPGDHHKVKRSQPGYTRVEPVEPFFLVRDRAGRCRKGLGAWEVGIRFNHADLNSGAIDAGTLDSVTLGLNWYLNANTRLMSNYVYSRRRATATQSGGFGHAFGIRMAMEF